MATRILLVRHGATPASAEDRFAGAIDVPLSPAGEEQARALGRRLEAHALDAVYSSPMKRTLRTAELACGGHKLAATAVPELREIHHGRWEGRSRREVEKEFAAEYACWEADPFTFAPEGGESGLAVLARALPALRAIVERHEGGTVLVVSHKATIRLLVGSLLGFDLRGYRDRLDQSPCCLNVLDFKDATRARLMTFNDISHYEDAPRRTQASLSRWWDAGGAKVAPEAAAERRPRG